MRKTYILDLCKAPTTPDLLLESRTSFSAGDVSMDTSSSDKTTSGSPEANSDDGGILRKSSIVERITVKMGFSKPAVIRYTNTVLLKPKVFLCH